MTEPVRFRSPVIESVPNANSPAFVAVSEPSVEAPATDILPPAFTTTSPAVSAPAPVIASTPVGSIVRSSSVALPVPVTEPASSVLPVTASVPLFTIAPVFVTVRDPKVDVPFSFVQLPAIFAWFLIVIAPSTRFVTVLPCAISMASAVKRAYLPSFVKDDFSFIVNVPPTVSAAGLLRIVERLVSTPPVASGCVRAVDSSVRPLATLRVDAL